MIEKKYGIIGKPLTHSLSPTLHNFWFKKYNINASYSLIEVDLDKIENIINKIKKKKLQGINVTVPYKQAVIPFLDLIINDAKETSSVNTIYLNDKNKIDFFFWHECNNTNPKAPNHSPDLSVITKDSDKIVVSYSTITSAMHLAAYMGAKNIFLCGHDCCEIQGKAWVDGYYDNIKPVHEDQQGYVGWLKQIKLHSVQVKFAIENNFDCNVFELTPTLFRESVTYE